MATPLKEEGVQEDRVYCLYYRAGNRQPAEKHFRFKGDLKAASERARAHCQLMQYVYIYTVPFIVDLDHQEKVKSADPGANFEERH